MKSQIPLENLENAITEKLIKLKQLLDV